MKDNNKYSNYIQRLGDLNMKLVSFLSAVVDAELNLYCSNMNISLLFVNATDIYDIPKIIEGFY